MTFKQRAIVVAILITLCISIAFTLGSWIRVEQLEKELAIQKADVYVLTLVQAELLNRHGLHLEDVQVVINKKASEIEK